METEELITLAQKLLKMDNEFDIAKELNHVYHKGINDGIDKLSKNLKETK